MSWHSACRGVSIYKNRGWYLERHMNHLADSTAKLCQGGIEGTVCIPIDNSLRKECEPVIVFESLDLSAC